MMLCRLLEDLDCTLVQGRSDIEVNAICCDSRSVTPGCVFVCLPGQHTDGRRFAHAAAAAGAAVLVFEGTLPNFEFSRSCSPALVQAEPGKTRRVLVFAKDAKVDAAAGAFVPFKLVLPLKTPIPVNFNK